jgi:hypothetical protein
VILLGRLGRWWSFAKSPRVGCGEPPIRSAS